MRAGEQLAGNFVIESQLGQGGMSIVYKAVQKSLSRPVAVKVLHSRFARDREFIARFEAEAGALAALQHPNIVNIIDRGHDGDHYFFVMEYVEGETLDQLIIANRLAPTDWRRVIGACREALDYIHRRGVVHRDIKPSNILVGREGLVKLGDFGIAHIVTTDPLEQARLQSPRTVGTANYMAPEQTSDPAGVDHRADIYSLGVTFYKMFTRSLPIGDFPMPSEANTDVPISVDDVIRRAMAHDRDARYQSAQAFCDDLLKALKVQSTSIAAVMSYRKGPKGALYTGDDFRSGTPTPSRDKTPKPKADERTPRKPGDPESAYSAANLLRKLTPLPVEARDKTPAPAPSAATPRPVATRESEAPASDRSHSLRKAFALAVTFIAIALVLAIVGIVMTAGEKQPTQAPPPAPSGTITEQRERMLEDIMRERNALMAEEPAPVDPSSDSQAPTLETAVSEASATEPDPALNDIDLPEAP